MIIYGYGVVADVPAACPGSTAAIALRPALIRSALSPTTKTGSASLLHTSSIVHVSAASRGLIAGWIPVVEGATNLHGVDGDVDAAVQQRLVDLFGEQPLAANVRQRLVQDLVAGGLDDADLQGAVLRQLRVPLLQGKGDRWSGFN